MLSSYSGDTAVINSSLNIDNTETTEHRVTLRTTSDLGSTTTAGNGQHRYNNNINNNNNNNNNNNGLIITDGKRSDSLTLIPWHEGRCATCDVTVTDTDRHLILGHFFFYRCLSCRSSGQMKRSQIYRNLSLSLFL